MAAENSPLKMACPGCGAPTPPEAQAGATLRCTYCGATYQVPDDSSGGGVNFHAAGSVTILGDIVGRDKVVEIRHIGPVGAATSGESAALGGAAGGAELPPPSVAPINPPPNDSLIARVRRWLKR
jgi:hypothetical protein